MPASPVATTAAPTTTSTPLRTRRRSRVDSLRIAETKIGSTATTPMSNDSPKVPKSDRPIDPSPTAPPTTAPRNRLRLRTSVATIAVANPITPPATASVDPAHAATMPAETIHEIRELRDAARETPTTNAARSTASIAGTPVGAAETKTARTPATAVGISAMRFRRLLALRDDLLRRGCCVVCWSLNGRGSGFFVPWP